MCASTSFADNDLNQSPDSLIDLARRYFREQFNSDPAVQIAVPGRVNLIGEHVDYNQGIVVPLGVNRYTAVVGSPRDDSWLRFFSSAHNELKTIDLQQSLPTPWPGRPWHAYVAGTMASLQQSPMQSRGMDLAIVSNLPLGAGLSSSAALTTAVAQLANEAFSLGRTWRDLASVCQQVEHRYLGVPCGQMDQWACLLHRADHLLAIDFGDDTFRQISWPDVGLEFLIINSGVKHALVDGQYAARRHDCQLAAAGLGVASLRQFVDQWGADSIAVLQSSQLEPTIARRAEHVVSEILRTKAALVAIERQEWLALGSMLNASHQSLRDLYEVSCDEVDHLVAIAQREPGVLGSRITGGGFGGATISLIAAERAIQITSSILHQYQTATGNSAQAFCTRPV